VTCCLSGFWGWNRTRGGRGQNPAWTPTSTQKRHLHQELNLDGPAYQTGRGHRTEVRYARRDSNPQTAGFEPACFAVCVLALACAARGSNPVPPGKGRIHHQLCLQRVSQNLTSPPRSVAISTFPVSSVFRRYSSLLILLINSSRYEEQEGRNGRIRTCDLTAPSRAL
jgi:hypothetical protein